MTLAVKFGDVGGGDILTDRSGLVNLGGHGGVIMMMQYEKTPRSVLWTRMAIVLAVALVMVIVLVATWTPPDNRGEAARDAGAQPHSVGAETVQDDVEGQSQVESAADFDDTLAREGRQIDINLLNDDSLSVLAPRWDSLYRGLDGRADSASLAIKFRQADSAMGMRNVGE